MRVRGGRSWWAHFEFTRINIEPIILRKKIEDLHQLGALCRKDRSRKEDYCRIADDCSTLSRAEHGCTRVMRMHARCVRSSVPQLASARTRVTSGVGAIPVARP